MAEEKAVVGEAEKKDTVADVAGKKKSRGIFSRLWSSIFRVRGDDFEKRLQHISKEEAAVLARLKRRSLTWRRMARNLIIFSIIFEIIAVCYAIITTRAVDMNWKMRAFRVLPMFLLPALSALAYTAFLSFTRMCDRKDQKTLESLRAERQAKIDELKEKTNYYITQQLIQRYDPDPAAKAAAATVLASKLGADSGLKVHLGDESNLNVPSGKSNDVEFVPPGGGLRNRKQGHSRSSSGGSGSLHHHDEDARRPAVSEGPHASEHNQLVVDHYNPQGPAVNDGGWLARIAALLVGEDPTQSYALICGNCHMHNGLVKREDFPFITYYCPHCHALNRANQSEQVSGQGSPSDDSVRARNRSPSAGSSPRADSVRARNRSPGAGSSPRADSVRARNRSPSAGSSPPADSVRSRNRSPVAASSPRADSVRGRNRSPGAGSSPHVGSVRARNTNDPTNTSGSDIDAVLTSNLHAETISEAMEKTESENKHSEGEKVHS